ncbi:class II aldolase/adducin family protein [Conexibacter stalactiti]|uniref:Class II aldolase/adducin family protein n=1 Tax=Conexibacter stalactiti TaxID=1940611 RepID=A0ABU4HMK6_9ACTN|nr:class II aldolase/adducin family protein [Conexibacter stalactiti]MDW5594550.1 class II aldolase/adducin family protein [Conexibacter stalactiti]MEC5035192.1 class II aldolase/adducin family protein [Conexibacter stalactiti]
MSEIAPAADVALAARVLAGAGLVEGFGHVSARAAGDAGGFLLTSTDPLAAQSEASIHLLDGAGAVLSAGEEGGVPLEAPLHAAIYAARPDVRAICRTHSRAAVVWGIRGAVPPLLHGLGGLAGAVATWGGDADLVTTATLGAAVAAGLGGADCLLVQGNGNVATGATLGQAVVRAWFLEERARVALDAGPGAPPLTDLDSRARHFAAEEARAWAWLREAFA